MVEKFQQWTYLHGMGEDEPAIEGIVCEHCMTPNDPVEKMCTECGAPLGDFASTAPWEYGKKRPKAYHEPTSPRRKPVILAAVWLLFGLPAVFGAIELKKFLGGILARQPVEAGVGEIIVVVLVSLYLLASVWVLFVVTRGFFRRR
jgi:hypothetical protein